jgi:hypothetical protein
MASDQIFLIDVDFASHDTLKLGAAAPRHSQDAGNPIDGCHRVTVLAPTMTDAACIAAQMVAATHPDCIPTATMFII